VRTVYRRYMYSERYQLRDIEVSVMKGDLSSQSVDLVGKYAPKK
jgi:hypothetical protein